MPAINLSRSIIILSFLWSCPRGVSQSHLAASFDLFIMRFNGSKIEQAKYLLRPVKKYAVLSGILSELPGFLDSAMADKLPLIYASCSERYLTSFGIDPATIGGEAGASLSTANGVHAGYFVIHDASNLLKGARSFSFGLNTAACGRNNLLSRKGFKYLHVFINRMGNSLTVKGFSSPVRATKLESFIDNTKKGPSCIGSFIHVELIQPRISDPGRNNDAIAFPGFFHSNTVGLRYFTWSLLSVRATG